MSDKPERFFLPTEGSLLGAFRAIREFIAAKARAEGRELDPAWYEDEPEDRPGLYPHLREEEHNESDDEN